MGLSEPRFGRRTVNTLLLEGPILPTLLWLAAPNVLNLLAFVGVIVFGLCSAWLATLLALRGSLLPALRNE